MGLLAGTPTTTELDSLKSPDFCQGETLLRRTDLLCRFGSLAAQHAARRYAGDRKVSVKRIEALQVAAMIDKLFGYPPAADWIPMDASPIVLALHRRPRLSTRTFHFRDTASSTQARARRPDCRFILSDVPAAQRQG